MFFLEFQTVLLCSSLFHMVHMTKKWVLCEFGLVTCVLVSSGLIKNIDPILKKCLIIFQLLLNP